MVFSCHIKKSLILIYYQYNYFGLNMFLIPINICRFSFSPSKFFFLVFSPSFFQYYVFSPYR